MEGLIALIVIIFAISSVASKSKKVVKNAPGGTKRPAQTPIAQKPAPKTAPIDVSPVRPVEPPVVPAVPDESDIMPELIDEGDSRACDHGSVGGSMDITDHQGMGKTFVHAEQKVKTTVQTTVKPSRQDGAVSDAMGEDGGIPRMSAAQMRQAVVMAEILKRPSERFGRRPIR